MLSSTIFQPEIDTLQSQVAQLQAKIVAAQERINQLGECETQAGSAIQMLQDAVTRIAGLAPDAIASLKASVLSLFNSGHGGCQVEQPVNPVPLTPSDTNREQHAIGQVQLVAPSDKPELAGQHSPLACQMTDAPLMGQYYELMCPLKQNVIAVYEDSIQHSPTMVEEAVSVAPNESVFDLVKVGDEVSYMKRSDTGEILCCYLGGSNKQTLKAWGEWLCLVHSVGTKFELRTAQRLTQFKHELKVWGMSLTQIQLLAGSDTMKRPHSNFGTAPKREAQRVPSDLEIADYKAGDVVRSATVRNWSYTVLAVTSDGLLEVERIGINPPIKSTLCPASVELVRRGGVVEVVSQEVAEHLEQQAFDSIQPLLHPPARIDVGDVPAGVRLLHGRDDLLTHFEVLMTVEARVMGRIQRQQKQIGMLTEVSGGVEALRPRGSIGQVFGRTLDAVAYLIAGSGCKPLHSVNEPVLVGAVSVDDDDF